MSKTVALVISIVLTVESLYIVGVSYSFGEDFNRTFNGKKCGERSQWILVEYDTVEVAAPHDSTRAIRAASESCTSSFPIVFMSGSTLEFHVFLRTFTNHSGLDIEVHNEDDVIVGKYSYNRSTTGFLPGWSKIALPVEENGVGYINLVGYSEDNEIVLVDSFYYTPNIYKIDDNDKVLLKHEGREGNVDNEFANTGDDNIENVTDELHNIIKNLKFDGTEVENDRFLVDDESVDGSGNVIYDPIISRDETGNSLTPWAIILIAVVSVTGLAILAVGAYHLGLIKGAAENTQFAEVEPASTVRIPRVRGVRESPIEVPDRAWEN